MWILFGSSVGEDFFSVSKNLIIDERLKGNLFAFGELITIEEDILNDAINTSHRQGCLVII